MSYFRTKQINTLSVRIQFQEGSGTRTVKNLSFSWSYLPSGFLEHGWLEKNHKLPGDWFELWDNVWSPRCCRQFSCSAQCVCVCVCICVCVVYPRLFFFCFLMERTGALKMIAFLLWNITVYQTSITSVLKKNYR